VDLGALYPGASAGEVARSWLGRPDAPGPVLVVVTLASEGAVAFSIAGEVRVPSVPVSVIDTVGAGDAFSAGLLEWLYRARHLKRDAVARLGSSEIAAALTRAAWVAGLTCTHAGADPPWLVDLERVLPG
jgi:fructokinase